MRKTPGSEPSHPPLPMPPDPAYVDPPRGLPEWLSWVQLGLTTMLVVLLGVLLVRGREQATLLRNLQQRVQALEARDASGGSAALERQLRSVTERLEALQSLRGRLNALDGQQQQLEQELINLRSRGAAPSSGMMPPPASGTAPPPPGPPARTQGTGLIRPPAQGSF